MSVRHSLILPWMHTYKLIEKLHFLGTSGIGVKIKSVLKYFWSLILNFITKRYTLLFLYFEIYVVHVINCEWSRFVNFPLRMFCMRYNMCFSNSRNPWNALSENYAQNRRNGLLPRTMSLWGWACVCSFDFAYAELTLRTWAANQKNPNRLTSG